MTKKDLTKMDLEKLTQELVQTEADLKQARLSKINNELANPQRIKFLKKQVARIKTAINALMLKESEEE